MIELDGGVKACASRYLRKLEHAREAGAIVFTDLKVVQSRSQRNGRASLCLFPRIMLLAIVVEDAWCNIL